MPFGPTGYTYDPEAVEQWCGDAANKTPVFASAGWRIRGSGAGKSAHLHQDIARLQGGTFHVRSQTIGNCVSKGWAAASEWVDLLMRARLGLPQLPRIAAAPYYGFSRVEVGKRRIRGDGSVGAWAAQAAVKLGCLRQQKYGAWDLTDDEQDTYARSWGDRGVPDELEPSARELLISDASLVTSWEHVRDAVFNQNPVVVCSRRGFNDIRDKDGFLKLSRDWGHCWAICSVKDDGRPGALLVNSWGPDWVSGPKTHDQPDGTGWIDAATIDRIVSEEPDSFAVSDFSGFTPNPWVMI